MGVTEDDDVRSVCSRGKGCDIVDDVDATAFDFEYGAFREPAHFRIQIDIAPHQSPSH